MRVLVVDVDGSPHQQLAVLLRSNKVIVDQTERGEEAVDLARHYDYDVVVADLALPDMDGYELIRRL